MMFLVRLTSHHRYSNVLSSNITANSALITWTTDEASNSVCRVWTDDRLWQHCFERDPNVTSHSIALNTLSANSLYHYPFESTDAPGNLATSVDHSFQRALWQLRPNGDNHPGGIS